MSPTNCKERIYKNWSHYACSRPVWKDGYCKTHHPQTCAARRAKSDANYRAKELESKRQRNERARETVREFLGYVSGHFGRTELLGALERWEREPVGSLSGTHTEPTP